MDFNRFNSTVINALKFYFYEDKIPQVLNETKLQELVQLAHLGKELGEYRLLIQCLNRFISIVPKVGEDGLEYILNICKVFERKKIKVLHLEIIKKYREIKNFQIKMHGSLGSSKFCIEVSQYESIMNGKNKLCKVFRKFINGVIFTQIGNIENVMLSLILLPENKRKKINTVLINTERRNTHVRDPMWTVLRQMLNNWSYFSNVTQISIPEWDVKEGRVQKDEQHTVEILNNSHCRKTYINPNQLEESIDHISSLMRKW